jgi:hypothetical protein
LRRYNHHPTHSRPNKMHPQIHAHGSSYSADVFEKKGKTLFQY